MSNDTTPMQPDGGPGKQPSDDSSSQLYSGLGYALGIVGLLTFPVLAVVGMVFGGVALKTSKGRRGMGAIVVSAVCLIGGLLFAIATRR